MTLVTGTVQDLGYDGMEGTLWARPARFRSDGSVVYAPERKPFTITGGVVSAELAPGPAVLELQVGSHARGTFEVVIPDTDITLADLLDTVFPWEPAQVSQFVAERELAVQAKTAAETAAGQASTAAGTATTAAQQTGQDRTAVAADKQVVVGHVQALAAPNDAAVLGLISEGATTQTKAALNATYAAKEFVGATGAAPLQGVTISPVDTGDYVPVDRIGGDIFGARIGSTGVGISSDGETWTLLGNAPAGALQRVWDSGDGAHIVLTSTNVYRVTGLVSGSPVWTNTLTVNGAAAFNRFTGSYDPASGKGIVSQYGPGVPQFADSRYGHITLDHGQTWTQVWDSDTMIPGDAPTDSHVHGSAYDPWDDVFYLIEGHGTQSGVWLSTDNGMTWNLYDGYRMYSAPTCIVPTDDGLVLTSDDPKSGLLGIPRVGPIQGRRIIRTYNWSSQYSGVIGFGQHAQRDPETGLVYAVYKSSYVDLPPVILAGTASAGSRVYTYDGTPANTSDYQFRSIVLLPGGKTIISVLKDGSVRERILAWRPGRATSTDDPGGIFGGSAPIGSSTAIGAESSTGEWQNALAAGSRAFAAQQSIGIGWKARANGTKQVVLGESAVASGSGTVLIGQAGAATGGQSTLVGTEVVGGAGGNSSAFGYKSKTYTQGSAIGAQSSVSALNGSALGYQAIVAAGHNNSVALGSGTATSRGDQVHIGPRHLAQLTLAADPSNALSGEVFFYFATNATGKIELRAKILSVVYTVWTQP